MTTSNYGSEVSDRENATASLPRTSSDEQLQAPPPPPPPVPDPRQKKNKIPKSLGGAKEAPSAEVQEPPAPPVPFGNAMPLQVHAEEVTSCRSLNCLSKAPPPPPPPPPPSSP